MSQPQSFMYVRIKAAHVKDMGEGVFGIEIPSQPLSNEQHKTLGQLFPNTQHLVEKALATEALLSSMVDPLQ